ncbi:MAG: DUF2207 domain-containing protein [Methanobrevibacter sp.]|uniref:DUF2207 domain-containing protein n=1 Tax=Methanobrevibacter sp. TaxID=66852 RepID=UPI0026DF54AE|nr:DUF2207 domain-containing protein [Methanobrevibacter sp.]MDO5849490.1 DUF2207 domain-containing protein [Methanobrevibacter sp.]
MNKKIAALMIISLFLISACSSAFAEEDEDRNYYIGPIDLFIDVMDNGLLKITESYNYTFKGEYHGVYRDIPLKEGEKIENLKVKTKGAYSKVTTEQEDNVYKITVYLYSDSKMTKPIRDTDVIVNYTYDFKNTITKYNDIAELNYQPWGGAWEKSAFALTAHITFPTDEKIQYWINPLDAETNQSWNGSTLTIYSPYVDSDSYLEFRGIIPLNEFKDPVYVKKVNEDGKEKIINDQNDYVNKMNFKNTVINIYPLILAISLICPVIIYLKYGREPKVSYDAPYERELPDASKSPLFVDAMFSTKTDTGQVSDNGIQATIMKLINDNVIEIVDAEKKNMRLRLPEKYDNLDKYEQAIIRDLLMPYARDNIVDFKEMKKTFLYKENAEKFNKSLKAFKGDFYENEIMPVINDYFDNGGSVLFRIYCGILALLGFIGMIYAIIQSDPPMNLFLGGILFFILGCVLFAVPNRIPGRWTEEGMTEYKQWKAFKKFLKDFSLMKEHPPESVEIWNDYLIYATALGNAKAVNKAMKSVATVTEHDYGNLYRYSSFDGPALFTSVVQTSNSTVSGGHGGVGGGSGGGGGGAF